jgi:hypothetical protein
MPTIAEERVQTSNASSEWRWTGDAWDRRSSTSLDLNYSLRLLRMGAPRETQTETKNVSYSGFYFQSATPFRPQEKVAYEIVMPWTASKGTPRAEMVLRGFARVVRVDASRPGAVCGVACRLEGDYTICRRDEEGGSSLLRPLPVAAEAW